ncbi:MAG: aspartyl/asparaginyl beta-hydroxylase domain-containing protein [Gammaproteobacteria bacterium]|nr:aspartyl/asparaginyl beta-hydroxylase domain-containing protein [Gammaproteobacteria bacterium]
MDIDVPLRELGAIDITALSDAILSQDEAAWHEDEYRQQSYDVHLETQSIVLVFTDGSGWPNADIVKEPGWDRLADVAIPLMHEIIDKHYPKGGTIIRAMAAKLLAGGKINPHVDKHPSFHCGHRIHIPITTNPRVRFMIDGRPYQFEIGQAYEINNQKQHSVMNKGKEDRITFIFDYVPPGPLAVQSTVNN